MRLEQYISQQGEMQKDFAKRAGIAQCIVSRICNHCDARGQAWARVMKATGGEVTPLDHFPVTKRRGKGGKG